MTVALDRARVLIDAARREYADVPHAREQLAECSARLDEPLRVALAGSLKAGKSTLLNALVGQHIAPTDATECTRVVTWYRRGATPSVTAWYDGDRTMDVPVIRREGRLTFDFGELTASRVDRLDVEWPARTLKSTTIIDTPGTSSLTRDVSARTFDMLTPEDSTSGADAVVYLMRTLNATDTAFLGRINDSVGGDTGPLGVIGVVSRADEVGAGRMDAMMSAKEVAARFSVELERTGLCQAVVPVAGLLALGARTLKQSEYSAFVALASTSPDDLQLAMLSADRFSRPDIDLPVDAATRAALVDRFGLFGIRMAVTLIRLGTRDSPGLAAELVERSGLGELRQVIDVQFGQRTDQLKTHSALVALERVLVEEPRASTSEIRAEASRMLGDVHGFRELRLLGQLRARSVHLPEESLAELSRIIGAYGIDTSARLGLAPDDGIELQRKTAFDAVRLWRTKSGHPLLDQFTSRACSIAARSAEGILAELDRA
ncbi:isoniazid-inducible protein iniC [Rhodococcoides trifolii]|uniref:Isoniazid-inducible protein iniC n=1 Tax=Rhodococcoides trifolii TaxID=908250 RepID=A0A917LIW7_9NOCA|nr:dynamin family protein [Rhodococcus trifolii]GGG28380.1 isoniazid-inducible protein iniC [Rhodococcus trifolii]